MCDNIVENINIIINFQSLDSKMQTSLYLLLKYMSAMCFDSWTSKRLYDVTIIYELLFSDRLIILSHLPINLICDDNINGKKLHPNFLAWIASAQQQKENFDTKHRYRFENQTAIKCIEMMDLTIEEEQQQYNLNEFEIKTVYSKSSYCNDNNYNKKFKNK